MRGSSVKHVAATTTVLTRGDKVTVVRRRGWVWAGAAGERATAQGKGSLPRGSHQSAPIGKADSQPGRQLYPTTGWGCFLTKL